MWLTYNIPQSLGSTYGPSHKRLSGIHAAKVP